MTQFHSMAPLGSKQDRAEIRIKELGIRRELERLGMKGFILINPFDTPREQARKLGSEAAPWLVELLQAVSAKTVTLE